MFSWGSELISVVFIRDTFRKLILRLLSTPSLIAKGFIAQMPIPFPHLRSPYSERVELPEMSKEQIFERWNNQPAYIKAIDHVVSVIIRMLKIQRRKSLEIFYQIIRKSFSLYFRIVNRLKVFGIANIPKQGCIFYVNHPGTHDPIIVMAAIPFRIGMLIAWGQSWLFDFIEKFVGIISLRNYPAHIQVERMVRNIIFKNPYFAIWPEGHPNGKQCVERGFNSIVKVYTTINSKKDLIPFVPVLLRGAHVYFKGMKEKRKIKVTNPIEVHILEPFFIDREWFTPNSPSFKTPREIIDYAMDILAKANGQKSCAENTLYQRKMEWLKKSGKYINC